MFVVNEMEKAYLDKANRNRKEAEELKSALELSKEWTTDHWMELPAYVKRVIVNGELHIEERIEQMSNLADRFESRAKEYKEII